MRKPALGANMTIFILFFGLATIDAINLHAWLRTTFWLGVAAIFILGDLILKGTRSNSA
jgi:hypothetical protein